MKAALVTRYGPPEALKLAEVATPVPDKDELLIRIRACTVTSADSRVRSARVPAGFGCLMRLAFGIFRPRQPVLGTELAGEVVAAGEHVRHFAIGDQVIAFTGVRMGCHAEYICLPERGMAVRIPARLAFDEAVALPFGGTTALHFLRKAQLQRGESILIIGASGGIGTAFVQLSAYQGAHVTAVCSGRNLELVRQLGAEHALDYTRTSVLDTSERYDVVVDTVGKTPLLAARKLLKDRGRLILPAASLPAMLLASLLSCADDRRYHFGAAGEHVGDVRFLVQLAEAGHYKAVIDRCYPFAQIAEAHRHVDAGHKRGNVVVLL